MTEEADHDGDDQHQSAREIGSAAVIAGVPAEKADDERKRSGGQNHAARINSKATDPLAKIVAFGLEYEPLITKEGESDGEEIGEQAGDYISVRQDWAEKQREEGEAAIAEDGVACADGQIANQG